MSTDNSKSSSKFSRKYCIFGLCKNVPGKADSSAYTFTPFPKACLNVRKFITNLTPQHTARCDHCSKCQRWLDKCGRIDVRFHEIRHDVNQNKYICSKHFVKEELLEAFPDPLPCEVVEQLNKHVFVVETGDCQNLWQQGITSSGKKGRHVHFSVESTLQTITNKECGFKHNNEILNTINFILSHTAEELQTASLCHNRWTITQVEALIAQYKTYPVLYSNSHKDRENVDLRNQCLSHVVQALQFVRPGVTAVDVVSQWNNLVIKYMQAARRQLEEPTGAEEPHLWYFKKMDFVGEHACLADVKVEDNAYDQDIFEPESTTEGHELWENGAGEDPLESSSRVSVKQEGDSPPTKKFREDEDTRESFSGSDRASKDENDVFGEFVAAELKKIADERIRQDTILEIHKVLHKALTKK